VTSALLSLGSNLGDRAGYLGAAVASLGEALLAVSGVYETPPWGDGDQPDYLNAVALVFAVTDDPRYWLRLVCDLETAAGRRRDPANRFAPRTLDVDVISITLDDGTQVTCGDTDLVVPHPRAHLRAFVLKPWFDLQPYAVLAGHGRIRDLIGAPEIAADLAALRDRPDITLETIA
jgi:2-amino-4-hydroxy-6-hydroxymethyldihydropteridine diphosphokinase